MIFQDNNIESDEKSVGKSNLMKVPLGTIFMSNVMSNSIKI